MSYPGNLAPFINTANPRLSSGATLIIVGIVAYFMKDTNEQTREMMKRLERVSSQVETASKDNDRLRADVEDIRNVLYNHITMTKK